MRPILRGLLGGAMMAVAGALAAIPIAASALDTLPSTSPSPATQRRLATAVATTTATSPSTRPHPGFPATKPLTFGVHTFPIGVTVRGGSDGYVRISPDMRHYAYPQLDELGTMRVALDGVTTDWLIPSDLFRFAYSPDSKHYAFHTWEDGKGSVIFDGKEQGPFFIPMGDHGMPVFSPDSQNLAYMARSRSDTPVNGVTPAADLLVVLNGKVLAPPAYRPNGISPPFVFNPGNNQLTYVTCHFDQRGLPLQCNIVRDGVEGERLPGTQIEEVAFSPDGKHIAYLGCMRVASTFNDGFYMDGKLVAASPCAKLEQCATLTYSPDGLHAAAHMYAADGRSGVLSVNGVIGRLLPPGDLGDKPVFSPDSRRIACIVRRSEKSGPISTRFFDTVVVDDVPQIECDHVESLGFSPDSKSVVYVGTKTGPKGVKTMSLMIDKNVADKAEEIVAPSYSPDGKYLAYLKRDGETWSIQVNGTSIPWAGMLRGPIVWESPTHFRVVGFATVPRNEELRSFEYTRIEVDVSEGVGAAATAPGQ